MEQNKMIVPIKEGFWVIEDNKTYLLGSQCMECEESYFPKKENIFCSHCHQKSLQDIKFKGNGEIIAFTNVNQQPAGGFYKGPVPYTFGIVRLEEGVNIYTLFSKKEEQELKIGQKVIMVIEKLFEDEEKVTMTYKFQPKEESNDYSITK